MQISSFKKIFNRHLYLLVITVIALGILLSACGVNNQKYVDSDSQSTTETPSGTNNENEPVDDTSSNTNSVDDSSDNDNNSNTGSEDTDSDESKNNSSDVTSSANGKFDMDDKNLWGHSPA